MEPYRLPSRKGLRSGCERELLELIRVLETVQRALKEECNQKVVMAESKIAAYKDQVESLQIDLQKAQERAEAVMQKSWQMEEAYRQQMQHLKEEVAQLKKDYESTSEGFHEELKKRDVSAILALRSERNKLQKEVEALRLQVEQQRKKRSSYRHAEEDDMQQTNPKDKIRQSMKKGEAQKLANQMADAFLQTENEYTQKLQGSILLKIQKVEDHFQPKF